MSLAEPLSFLLLGGLLWFFFGPWQTLWTDWARERIFAERDQLFLYAANGDLDFESAEYQQIRKGLERMLRFAHKASLFRMFFLSFFLNRVRDSENDDPYTLASRIGNHEVRRRVWRCVTRSVGAIIVMMVMRSPLLWPVATILVVSREVFGKRMPPSKKSVTQKIIKETVLSDELVMATR